MKLPKSALTAVTFSFSCMCILGGSAQAAMPLEALPDVAPSPADNPTTPEKVELGQVLYFDPRLSSTGTVSCNSCHNVMLGGEDNRPVSVGVNGQTGGRSAPTVWNAAFSSTQFWDSRAASLEEQAVGPIANPIEMGMPKLDDAIAVLKSIEGYDALFTKAFGPNSINADNLAKAIAAYERTLITPNSPYDRYAKGDKSALTPAQVKGMEVFASTGCTACHSGAAFMGPKMPPGVPFLNKFPTFADNEFTKKYDLMADEGRKEVTGKASDAHMFKVPTLRNVALTAPYFHNGAVKTLDEAVRVMAKTQLNKDLSESDVNSIVEFLGALSGEFPEQNMPRLPGTPGTSAH